tara:strand:- start:4826 stop:6532 length:1707 start_codon:yes stop_codon:yes gene_type:complete
MKANLFTLFFIVFISAKSQSKYDFPVELPVYLSGSFAELRPNHFHSGIDIKTRGKTGYKIYSLEDGYIQRIQITLGGNGKALYIKHDNGQSSVYAHLEKFSPRIQKIVKEIQYSEKKFEIRLFPKKNQYRIKKKELIGFSGNTGRSTGPHLHYEIRDKNDNPINPLTFKKEKLEDTIPPIIKSLFYKQLFKNNEGLFEDPKVGFKKLNFKKIKEKYISDTLKVSAIIGFGIDAFDKMNFTNNVMGINKIETFLDNNKIFNMDFNKFSFNEWRHINTFIDYATYKKNKLTIQKLFTTYYNPLEMYDRSLGDGSMDLTKLESLNSNNSHIYKILLYDFNSNITEILVPLIITENFNKTIPNEIKDSFHRVERDKEKSIEGKQFNLRFKKNSFYQNSYLDLNEREKSIKINSDTIPLLRHFDIEFKLGDNEIKQLYISQLIDNKFIYLDNRIENGFLKASSKTLGSFYIKEDSIAPNVEFLNIQDSKWYSNLDKIKIKGYDNETGIKSYSAWINEKWILLEYDIKKNLFFYDFSDRVNSESIANNLKVEIKDNVGNTTTKEITFYRKINND